MYFCINSVLRTIFPAAEKIYDMKKIIIFIIGEFKCTVFPIQMYKKV